jgi:membrane-bound metal-dependent hydrolase YbcI (DUF457 family)
MNWYQHLAIGLFVLFSFLLLLSHLHQFGTKEILLTGIPLLIGCLIPDIDHPKSKIRKVFNFIFVILSFFAGLLVLSFFLDIFLSTLAAIALTAIAFVFVSAAIPAHRGILHSYISAIAFGALCFAIILKFDSFFSAFLAGLSGAVGYLLHILADAL